MLQRSMKITYMKTIYITGIYCIVLLSLLGNYNAQAQQPFGDLFNGAFSAIPSNYYGSSIINPVFETYFFSGFPSFYPVIRNNSVCYRNTWNLQKLRPAIPAPRPVIRQAAATISILITQGPTQALLVYNPTLLFGQSTPTIIPTALTLPALLGGNPLIFGSAPITSSNIAVFNYVANNLILPSGIALYIIP